MTDLRTIERESIRSFVQRAADEGYLSGRVLDYGCGKQPYRDIVEAAGGEYHAWDRESYPGNVSGEDIGDPSWPPSQAFDSMLCTQVLQYVTDVPDLLYKLQWWLTAPFGRGPGQTGHLVLTYPTNWPEVEPEDLHRFTKAGMERLLTEAEFEIVLHEQRGQHIFFAVPGGRYLNHGRGEIALGYGVVARA